MKLLAIDTSTEYASVALVTQGIITEKSHPAQRQHAQFLLPIIDDLLIDSGVSLSELDGIVFGCGPGSFTGLRITCSIAKGLAYAHDLPLYPASSLETIAARIADEYPDHAVLAMIDARMNQVYWRYFSPHQHDETEQVSFVRDISVNDKVPIILAGVGFEAYWDQIPSALATKIIDKKPVFPTASAMLRLALEGKLRQVTADEASPIYVRNQVTQGVSHG